MKLIYTEFRPTVNRSTVEDVAEITEISDVTDFRDGVLKEIGVCMDNDAQDVAHKLLDWHREVYDSKGIKPGAKLVVHYGTGLDPVGTWEIVE